MSLDSYAHDTGVDGEDAANSNQEEVTSQDTGDDTGAVEDSSSSSHGGGQDDHQVPLAVLLEERAKRQAIEREHKQLKQTWDEKAPMLQKFEEALPEVRNVYSRSQELESENERLKREVDYFRSSAQEHGFEFDEKEYEEKQMMRSLAQQVQHMPEMFRAEMRQWQVEQEAKQRVEAKQRQEREEFERASERFNKDFDEMTKNYPALQVQKPLYESIFESNRGQVSAKELIDPILQTINGATGASARSKQVRSVTGQHTAGNAAGADNVMAPRQRETLTDYFDRIRRAQASGEI